jgi:sec-independent protein translocase protein TatA
MGSLSIWHWLIVIVVLLLLFGSGKVSHLMGDFAKGIKSFKKNMAEDDDASMADGKPQGSLSAPGPDANAPKRETTSVHSQG